MLPPAKDLVGTLVSGRYRVERLLGKGGMGAVYLAEQEPLQRKVALKVLGGRHAADPDAEERFVREARAASRLSHPNIATVYDFGGGEHAYLAMELVEGATLKEIIKESAPLPWERAVHLATQVARGLAAAHTQGIVHRDVKPANVIVTKTPEGESVKILDFGLANARGDDPELTDTGVVMGTAAYMSPEQCHGVRHDVRSDLYALGVVLYEMLAGRRPFVERQSAELIVAHVTRAPPPLARMNPEVPDPVCELVHQLLAKDPQERPDDGRALVRVIDAMLRGLHDDDSAAEARTGSAFAPAANDGAPEGEVSLVFTDIEGSSTLWDRAPRAMRAALDIHDRVMRETLRLAGGYEVKTQGDAFMVAFRSALDAVTWCLEVQRSLAGRQWPADLDRRVERGDEVTSGSRVPGLRVRMGVYVGSPDCRRDPVTGRMDYFGGAVNRAARIESAAHGGQILVGDLVAQRVKASIDDLDAQIEGRGEHHLKGIDESEHLVEIVDLRGPRRRFPPPRTRSDHARTNLGPEPTQFVGRARERDEIAARFAEGARLVTLLGPGGTGKTRLSRMAARDLLDAGGPEEAWFCDLSAAKCGPELVATVAGILGAPLAGSEALEDSVALVGRNLERRGAVLLVVDNLEQVISAAPEIIRAWLAQADRLTCIATSREPLGIAGELRFELDPLQVEQATELFYARVLELGQPRPDDDGAVRELVQALDGMPLAIELAASRAGLMKPRQILERINQRFQLLRGSRRDVSARQATLRGAIDWSWDLLTAAERDAFAQCAAFDGPFSIEAAEAVIDVQDHEDAPFVLDLIQALKEKSLLRTVPADDHELRLAMLMSIHAYAREKLELDAERAERVFERHADYFVREGARHARASTAGGGQDAIQWLITNRQNLEEVIARRRASDPASAVRAANALVPVLREREPTASYRAILEDSLALAREAGDEILLADTLIYRASLEQERGSAEEAIDLVDEAMPLLPAEHPLRAVAGVVQTRALTRTGPLADVDAVLDEAEPIARKNGMNSVLARIYMQRGLRQMSGGEDGSEGYGKALALARRIGNRNLEARVLSNIGIQQLLRGALDEAEHSSSKALELHRECGNRGQEGLCLGNLGVIALSQSNPDVAEGRLRAAIEIHESMGNQLLAYADQVNLAAAVIEQLRFREGIAIGEAANQGLARLKGVRERMTCGAILAAAYAAIDQPAHARALAKEAEELTGAFWHAQMPSYFRIVRAHIELAEARLEGQGEDDPRVLGIRQLIDELAAAPPMIYVRCSFLERILSRFPKTPVDRSEDTLSAPTVLSP